MAALEVAYRGPIAVRMGWWAGEEVALSRSTPRPMCARDGDGTVLGIEYDALGRVTRFGDVEMVTRWRRGRPIVDEVRAGGEVTERYIYRYDAAGRVGEIDARGRDRRRMYTSLLVYRGAVLDEIVEDGGTSVVVRGSSGNVERVVSPGLRDVPMDDLDVTWSSTDARFYRWDGPRLRGARTRWGEVELVYEGDRLAGVEGEHGFELPATCPGAVGAPR